MLKALVKVYDRIGEVSDAIRARARAIEVIGDPWKDSLKAKELEVLRERLKALEKRNTSVLPAAS